MTPGGANGPDVATLRQIMANAFDIDDNLSFGAALRSSTLLEEDSQLGPGRVAMGDMTSSSFGGGGGEGGGSFDDEIERMFAEIRHLKSQIIAYDTLDLFEQGILRNKAVSTNESLREDGLQRSAKEALQKVKAERRELYESGLKSEVTTLVDTLSLRARARATLNEDIDLVSAVAKARHAEDYLFSKNNNSDNNHNNELSGTNISDGDSGARTLRAQQQKLNRHMAVIDGHAGDMSLSTCQQVMDDLQESFDALATAQHDVDNRLAGLRNELTAGESLVARKRTALADMQARVNLFESRCGSDAAAVRQDRELVATHRETGRYLRALSALHLREMRADGMSFIVDTGTLLPVVHGGSDGGVGPERERERVSHVVDIVYDTRRADEQAAKIAALVDESAAMRERGSRQVPRGEGQGVSGDVAGGLTLQALFDATSGVQTADLIVSDVVVEPCDVQLDVRGMSLEWALRLLLSELRRATYDRAMTTATMTNATMTT